LVFCVPLTPFLHVGDVIGCAAGTGSQSSSDKCHW